MTKYLLLLVTFSSFRLVAQQSIAISGIPDSLLVNANAVVRSQHHVVDIIDESTATERVSVVVSVLNGKAAELASLHLPFDKFSKVVSVSGAIYAPDGALLKKVKKADFTELSANSGGTLYGDNRMLAFESPLVKYPLTYRFEYEISYSGLLFVPSFDPVPDYYVSVEQAEFSIKVPEHVGLRALPENWNFEFTDLSSDAFIQRKWELKQFKALTQEPFSPPPLKIFPYVYIGINKFGMEQYPGEMDSWNKFGAWIFSLNEGKSDLSAAHAQQVANMTDGLSEREKIRVLYEYMQSKTRYVSIQLGIGGWQPFPASTVEMNGYGDCKALVNYMKNLLSLAQINSYYTLIKAGTRAADINTDFPSSQFNHVILCVPMEKDTVWLECTSQNQHFGFLGSFTADRHALLINDTGGHLIKTPKYTAKQNLQITNSTVDLREDGLSQIRVHRESFGIQTENGGLDNMAEAHETEQKKWLKESIGIESLDIANFKLSKNKEAVSPSVITDLQASAKNIYTKSGKRVFIKPNVVNAYNPDTEHKTIRKNPIYLRSEFTDIDTVSIAIPAGFQPEYLPPSKDLNGPFGEYSVNMVVGDNGILTYRRKLVVYKGIYPAESYPELLAFFKEIKKSDEQKIVLVSSQ